MSIMHVLSLVLFMMRVSHGNRHEYVDFLYENGYLFKVTKLCIPWTSFMDFINLGDACRWFSWKFLEG